MKKQIQISGIYKHNNKSGPFTGMVTFDERENLIYYTWDLRDEQGNSLGFRGMPVAFQQIPMEKKSWSFLKHMRWRGLENSESEGRE